jgi:hypothetical protein
VAGWWCYIYCGNLCWRYDKQSYERSAENKLVNTVATGYSSLLGGGCWNKKNNSKQRIRLNNYFYEIVKQENIMLELSLTVRAKLKRLLVSVVQLYAAVI